MILLIRWLFWIKVLGQTWTWVSRYLSGQCTRFSPLWVRSTLSKLVLCERVWWSPAGHLLGNVGFLRALRLSVVIQFYVKEIILYDNLPKSRVSDLWDVWIRNSCHGKMLSGQYIEELFRFWNSWNFCWWPQKVLNFQSIQSCIRLNFFEDFYIFTKVNWCVSFIINLNFIHG